MMKSRNDLNLFLQCFEPLTDLESQTSKTERKHQWQIADVSRNGFLSLAELDMWIKNRLISLLHKDEGVRLWVHFRPCYIRAFSDAADACNAGDGTDQFVQRREFRLFCAYLVVYPRMFDAFSLLDGFAVGSNEAATEDRRISQQEWKDNYFKAKNHGFVGFENLDDDLAMKIFYEIDTNNGGMVLLDEWCAYLKRKEIDANTKIGKILSIGD